MIDIFNLDYNRMVKVHVELRTMTDRIKAIESCFIR